MDIDEIDKAETSAIKHAQLVIVGGREMGEHDTVVLGMLLDHCANRLNAHAAMRLEKELSREGARQTG